MLGNDPGLLQAFFDESEEFLAGLESQVVALPDEPDRKAAVGAIFRPVHSLKGSAPFFGCMRVQQLAHAVENVLDPMRQGRLDPSPAVADAILAGIDGLRAAIARLREGRPEVEDEAGFRDLLDRLSAVRDPARPAAGRARLAANLAELERECGASSARARELILQIRQDSEAVHGPDPGSPTTRRTSPPPPGVGGEGGASPTGRIRARLAAPLKEPLPREAGDAIVADLEALRRSTGDSRRASTIDDMIGTCAAFMGSIGFDEMLRSYVLEHLDHLAVLDREEGKAEAVLIPSPAPMAATEPAAPSPDSERRRRETATEGHAKSMRVSEAAVDGFLAYVGDLLVIGDQLDHLQRRFAGRTSEAGLARDMRQAVAAFSLLSTKLQSSIMAVRRVMVRPLLQKAPRLVRDIAQATGKDMAVSLDGESVEVDKSRLDLLDAPLTHLVRNCADHGIEPPGERRAAGKPERGTISITAATEAGWFTLTIADDGRGLDLAAIRRKGEALGLVKPGDELGRQALIDLIFASGLSTAATVSDVSGRGVGMDVVKRNLAEAGGVIEIDTEPGRGTTFRLRVPCAVTTQIIRAYLMREEGGVYAIPLDRVRETFADAVGEDASLQGFRTVMRLGTVIPVIPLGQAFGQRPGSPPAARGRGRRTLVSIQASGRPLALSIDEPLGVRQVVVRPIAGITGTGVAATPLQGAALLGDGRLALVLDPDRLLAPTITGHP